MGYFNFRSGVFTAPSLCADHQCLLPCQSFINFPCSLDASQLDRACGLNKLPITAAGDDTVAEEEKALPSKLSAWTASVKKLAATILNPTAGGEQDFYISTFLVEFVAFFLICFGWAGFRPEEQYQTSAADALSKNHIPSGQLVYMLLQFVLIVAERAIYLTRSLKIKVAFTIFNVLLIHGLVFYWIPASTYRSLSENGIIVALYLFKVRTFWGRDTAERLTPQPPIFFLCGPWSCS
jgi:hypothetical protein